jgi:hypothetical protein
VRNRKQLLIDCIDGRWRLELQRDMDLYGVRVLIIGRLRFVLTWPVPPIEVGDVEDAAAA